jgi:hypothetical protein
VAQGHFGDFDRQWFVGQPVTMGYVIENDEPWLYVDGYGCFRKWQPFTTVLQTEQWQQPSVCVYTETGTENATAAFVSNLSLLTR